MQAIVRERGAEALSAKTYRGLDLIERTPRASRRARERDADAPRRKRGVAPLQVHRHAVHGIGGAHEELRISQERWRRGQTRRILQARAHLASRNGLDHSLGKVDETHGSRRRESVTSRARTKKSHPAHKRASVQASDEGDIRRVANLIDFKAKRLKPVPVPGYPRFLRPPVRLLNSPRSAISTQGRSPNSLRSATRTPSAAQRDTKLELGKHGLRAPVHRKDLPALGRVTGRQ